MREEIGGRLGVERVDSLRVVPRSPLSRQISVLIRSDVQLFSVHGLHTMLSGPLLFHSFLPQPREEIYILSEDKCNAETWSSGAEPIHQDKNSLMD